MAVRVVGTTRQWFVLIIFLTGICDGKFLSDSKFNLLTYNSDGNVMSFTYTSVYVIVDNGYLPWLFTVPPFLKTNKLQNTVVKVS